MKLKHLSVELDSKAIGDDGTFEGYAATFGNKDAYGEICIAGCFEQSLKTRPAAKVKMLIHHDTHSPIGVWESIVEDSKGLKVKGRILQDIAKGAEALSLMRNGVLDSLSIGFKTIRDEVDRKTNIRKLLELDLYEISPVVFPANDQATISAVKAELEIRSRVIAEMINRATAQINKVNI